MSEPPPYRDSESLERRPMRATYYFKNDRTGNIVEVNALVMPAELWPSRREAKDPMWKPLNFGGLIVAITTLS